MLEEGGGSSCRGRGQQKLRQRACRVRKPVSGSKGDQRRRRESAKGSGSRSLVGLTKVIREADRATPELRRAKERSARVVSIATKSGSSSTPNAMVVVVDGGGEEACSRVPLDRRVERNAFCMRFAGCVLFLHFRLFVRCAVLHLRRRKGTREAVESVRFELKKEV
jgi:hypothetical protein